MKAEGVKAPEQKVLITDRNKEESKGEEPEAQQDQQESFDPYEFADEKDCLANYNEEWAEKLVACPKWDQKRDLLQDLAKDTAVIRLKPYDTSSLVTCLKKTLTDSNIVVAQLSIKICGQLAGALRTHFKESAKALVNPLLKKFAEKRTQVISDNQAALQNFLQACSLPELLENVMPALQDKNPNVIRYSSKFIESGVKLTFIDDLQDMKGQLIPALFALTNHSDKDVRDAALEVCGLFKGRLGEAIVGQYFKDLNAQKLAKINEAAGKYEKTDFDMTKKERAKKAKQDATPVVDERKDVDDFKKVIESLDAGEDAFQPKPAGKKKPAGPPAGFLERQKKATEKVEAPPLEEEKGGDAAGSGDADAP